jgi:hypothetical protein
MLTDCFTSFHAFAGQRREYKLLRKGLPSRLTHDRLQKLEKINFLWKAGRGGPRVQRDSAAGSPNLAPDAPSDGAAGITPLNSQTPPTQSFTANPPPGIAAPSGYALPPGTAFLLTNAGAFPAILAQPNALAPLHGLIAPQQVGGAPADPSQQQAANAASTTAAAAAAAAATVLNLLPLLAQTAAATAPGGVVAMPPGLAAATEDPSVAALRLLLASGVVPSVGVGGATGASQAAPAAISLVGPPAFGTYGASPSPGAAAAPTTAPGVPPPNPAILDPQAAMNLALTLQLLTRAQAGSGFQPQHPDPSTNAAEGAGNNGPGPDAAQR